MNKCKLTDDQLRHGDQGDLAPYACDMAEELLAHRAARAGTIALIADDALTAEALRRALRELLGLA